MRNATCPKGNKVECYGWSNCPFRLDLKAGEAQVVKETFKSATNNSFYVPYFLKCTHHQCERSGVSRDYSESVVCTSGNLTRKNCRALLRTHYPSPNAEVPWKPDTFLPSLPGFKHKCVLFKAYYCA